MQNEPTARFRPPTGAHVLIYLVCVVLAQPAALILGSILLQEERLLARSYGLMLLVVVPIAICLAYWITSHQELCVGKRAAVFRFTRYTVPRVLRVEYRDVSEVGLLGGIFGLDNRPRPVLIFTLKTGEQPWVPLSLYSKRQSEELIALLRSHGVGVSVHKG